jgi:hypothetical protein
MCLSGCECPNLIGLQLDEFNVPRLSVIEALRERRCSREPAVSGIPADAFDSSNSGPTHTFYSQSGGPVENAV